MLRMLGELPWAPIDRRFWIETLYGHGKQFPSAVLYALVNLSRIHLSHFLAWPDMMLSDHPQFDQIQLSSCFQLMATFKRSKNHECGDRRINKWPDFSAWMS